MDNDAPSTQINRKSIRAALRDWDSLKNLSTSALTGLQVVCQRRLQKGYADSLIGSGLALREVLQEALESLRPVSGSENPTEKRWRPYYILKEQFINGRKPEWIEEQIHISKAAYYLEQEHALNLLIEQLEKFEGEAQLPSPDRFGRQKLYGLPPVPPYRVIGRVQQLSEAVENILQGNIRALGITGLPGIGKTTFLLTLANHPDIQTHFSDGVLWAGLGKHPDLFDILGGWATALGFSSEQIAGKQTIAARMQMIQKNIYERQMLLVIDDAWSAEDALTFRLGGPGCACLISSRQSEVLLDSGAEQILALPELDADASMELLSQVAPKAVNLAPQETRSLLDAISGLPLGLILIGGYLQKQSFNGQARRVQTAIQQLASPQARLNLSQLPVPMIGQFPALGFGERLSLQSIISLSDSQLDPPTRQALISLAVFPPKPIAFSEAAAMAVINGPVQYLDNLVDAGLVESRGNGFYALHQSIHDYAHAQNLPEIAIQRLIAYFSEYLAEKIENPPRLEDDELAIILHLIDLARQYAYDEGFLNLSLNIYPFLEVRGRYPLSRQLLTEAQQKAIQLNAPKAIMHTEYFFGNLEIKLGNFLSAIEHLNHGLKLALELKDVQIEASIHLELSLAYSYSGNTRGGKVHIDQAIALEQEFPPNEAHAFGLVARGYFDEELCDFPAALQHLETAMQYCLANNVVRSAGWAQFNLSMVYLPLGEIELCWQTANACRTYYEQVGDLRGLTWLEYHLGRIYRHQGDYPSALAQFISAETVFADIDDHMGLGFAVLNHGLVLSELGNYSEAESHYEKALAIFEQINCIGSASVYYCRAKLALRREDYLSAEKDLEKALKTFIAVDFSRGEAKARGLLAMLLALRAENESARAEIQLAEKQIEAMRASANSAFIAVLTGHIDLLDHQPEFAGQHFQHAYDLRKALHLTHLLYEPLAGLAAASAAGGDRISANAFAKQAVQLALQSPEAWTIRVERPLTCYRYLLESLQPQEVNERQIVSAWLANEIQRTATQIDSEEARQAYLQSAARIAEISG
ncbi:MAG TPA: NB-ARC domain-containing protein [Bellilinea sp.]|nr:NB-ARC domain-containing protein [Bellilinea sp.]